MGKIICLLDGARNNIFVTVMEGSKVIIQKSIGHAGLKNSSKKTVFGAELLGKYVGDIILSKNILSVDVRIQGKWFKSEKGCVVGLCKSGINVKSLEYKLKSGHNGVRNKKRKRR